MIRPLAIFDRVTRLVFTVILLFLALGLLIGAGKLFLSLTDLLSTTKVTGSYLKVISDVLSLFILIELSRSLVDYFDTHRVRMSYIVDAGLVFILRELMIGIFEQKLSHEMIYALSLLLLVLGALRVASVLLYQREHAMNDNESD
ncbi:MAG: phosphate-starvation-inducible PsiE family protein [Candidatus Thiodiazotropha sp.]|jgi:uncharacterized membrane protein (DUF373 family)